VENIFRMLKALYKKNSSSPICYFEFVTNPESFSQTIENVFYTSFLLAHGFARMFLDDDELPVIEPVAGANIESLRSLTSGNVQLVDEGPDDGECHQMVMPWTMQGWRDIVESFEITRPLIPARAVHRRSSLPCKTAPPPTDRKHLVNGTAAPRRDVTLPSCSRPTGPTLVLTKSTPTKPTPPKPTKNHIIESDEDASDVDDSKP
jgi:hypothetical protein